MKNLKEITEGHFVFDSKTLTENDLAVHIEIINMSDATGEPEFDQYPYLVSFTLIAHTPHVSYDETEGRQDRLSLIYDAVSYMGGVPIDHKLQDLNEDKAMNALKIQDAMLATTKSDFGTIAAQYGKGYEFTYPQFKTAEAALKYARKLLKHVDDLDFDWVIDQPINMMGTSGRNTIDSMREGK